MATIAGIVLRRLGALAEQEKNPLYVWRAIHLVLNDPVVGGAARELPDWCIDYLAKSAAQIHAIAGRGCDEALTSRKVALKKVSEALGLSRKGWNAFERLQSADEAETWSMIFQTSPGDTDQVIDMIKSQGNLEHRRSAMRIVKTGEWLLSAASRAFHRTKPKA